MKAVLASLPRGKTLPTPVWARRHRTLVWLVWAHAVALPLFGLTRGYGLDHVLIDGLPIAFFAGLAALPVGSKRFRASAVSMGLLTSSAILVHLWGGQIEAHFHFFVMVTILATYEEWLPYLIAVSYVVFHHGTVGVLESHSAYSHQAAYDNPWKWAAIRGAFEDAPIGMAIVDSAGSFARVNRSFSTTTGYPIEALLGMKMVELVPQDAREEYRQTWSEKDRGELERRFVRADGSMGWGLWQRTTASDGQFLLQCLDISERKHAEQQLELAARADALTGVPNRV